MEWFVRAFLKASLTWLALGVTLGATMAAHPEYVVYRPAHAHMMLLGFVTMMIFGVAYHVIPRFTGFPLHSRRAAGWQWFLSNGGLVLMVTGFVLRANGVRDGTLVLSIGGTLAAMSAYTFAYVLWRTIDGPPQLRDAARRAKESAERARAVSLPMARSAAQGD
jgi:cbb3-type cytochrome oxidase subunit 1